MGNCQNASDATSATPTSKSKGSSHIIVTTFTWARDSHGLFDYESKSLTKKAFKAQGTGVIRRSTNDIGFTKDNDKTAKLGDRDLLKLSLKQGNFWINACGEQDAKLNKEQTLAIDPGSLEQDPWLVIKSFKNNTNRGYKLNEGDLIKLGRVKYRIREIKGTPTISNQKNSPEKQAVNTEVDNNNSLEESFKKSPRVHKESQGNINNSCRICLSETCEPDNPFFSPCNCAGTMKLIHVKCLQTWLKSKLHMKTSGHTTFIYWKTLECELCKFPYPQCLEVDNKKYDIVEIERPDCAYIVLEVLSKEKNVTKGVHIIKMEGKSNIRLGRGHDSDIRITDISVSRCHAMIKLGKGNFYIEDNSSKFGTLVHFRKPFPLVGDFNNISVQVGRTVLSLAVKKNWRSLGWFGGSAIREPIEIEEEEEGLFGKSQDQNIQPTENNAMLSRRPISVLEEPHEIGGFDNDNVRGENGLPSPIQQQEEGGEGALEEDRLSDLSEEQFPEAELPENQEEGIQLPEGQVVNNVVNHQPSEPQQAVVVQSEVVNLEQANNNQLENVPSNPQSARVH